MIGIMMKNSKNKIGMVFRLSLLILAYSAFSSFGFAGDTPIHQANDDRIKQLSTPTIKKSNNILARSSAKGSQTSPFVEVQGNRFFLQGKPYYYIGANFWQAMNLASKGAGGNREQFIRELDFLQAKGITNLRIICASEGPNSEPYRVIPTLMPAPGVYDEALLDGLDFALKAMNDRGMKAIMVLGNMWCRSGGFGQHLVWSGFADTIPYPPPYPDGDWDAYQYFVANFYSDPLSAVRFRHHVAFLTSHYNSYTQKRYRDDPAIMAWELANEPRGMDKTEDYLNWVKTSSAFIKQCDGNHLVTIGSEGITPWPDYTGTKYVEAHRLNTIDYATAHIRVQNWNWFDPLNPKELYERTLQNALEYIDLHIEKTAEIGKPLVLEEFGIARDDNSYDPSSPVTLRDKYYTSIFEHLYNAAASGTGIAGANFWAWSGEARPGMPLSYFWQSGDPLRGNPSNRKQKWCGIYDTDTSTVYNTDTSTISIIETYAGKMQLLSSLAGH